ncbi:MAG TPA: ribonuclease HII [Erysipelotrichaceae bacterium]|nr:ribonuclease HII [Erysipelotrichaceae bacterium]HQA85648.1 ribonuclease HII [Erysipelotrichaceae bacterium]
MKTINDFEKHYWSLDKLVIGIDEAGRGPLAGPLVVAGVVFPKDYISEEIYDSKQLTEKKREQLYEVIIRDALYYDVVIVEVEIIEKLNILEATRWGMSEIAKKANVDIVLTDALKLDINKEVVDIVKGDQKSISIAAASILAKVTRDRIMYKMDEKYPEYNFKNNKGYPTKQHFKALEKYGITEIHRKNYKPVIKAMQSKLF